MPCLGLGYERTPDYHERTRLMGVQNFIGQLAYVIVTAFTWAKSSLETGRILARAGGIGTGETVPS